MPIVELTKDTETFNLKSAPPDGFVTLRRMSHGETLRRRDGSIATSVKEFDKQGQPGEIFMASHQEWMRYFDFQLCIVDHNLQMADGSLINFKNKKAFDALPTAVGLEIEEYIDKVNQWNEYAPVAEVDSNGEVTRPLESPVSESSQDDPNLTTD
jgi:hypothetical protein